MSALDKETRERIRYAAGHLAGAERHPEDAHAGDSLELAWEIFEELFAGTLPAMQAEVLAVNEANGWFDAERSVVEGNMLMVTEVAEETEAFRSWGLEDMTGKVSLDKALYDPETDEMVCKPEGVGSEQADQLIRLLDQAQRTGVDLVAEYRRKLRFNRLRGDRHGGKRL